MSHSPIGQPPPGTDLAADHPLNISPVIATYVIAVVVVGLRFYTRFQVQGVRVLADDWIIVLALVCGHCKKKNKRGESVSDRYV